jgi:regulator of cell morphogenesis and NO signaling
MTAVMAGSRPKAEPSRMTTPLAPPTHDLSGTAPRTEDVLSIVDALAPGQLLTLRLSAETARALITTLTAERKGLFEWSPEADESAVRVDVVRRDAAPGSKRGVFEALSWDHDRIDAFEQGAFAARAAGDLEAARALFERFARGLFRHIGFEEDLLFPALESATGLPRNAGPTAVMRAEHVEIRAAVQLLRDAIGDPSVDPTPLRQRLHGTLGPHNEKEGRILYPMADRVLSGPGSDELVAAIQAYEAR